MAGHHGDIIGQWPQALLYRFDELLMITAWKISAPYGAAEQYITGKQQFVLLIK